MMANKRYQETQEPVESSRKLRANLREHPMPLQEALRVICEIHTVSEGLHCPVRYAAQFHER
jgi:hypothetical protein